MAPPPPRADLAGQIIPLAEDTGLIVDIARWVMDEALRHLATWNRSLMLPPEFYMAVNLSAAQLGDPRLAADIRNAITRHGVRPTDICLEITESVVMADPLTAETVLSSLRALGLKLAIDDFGTEYSSLAYLRRFPVTSLKIDKSFVDNLGAIDSADATVVAAVVALARGLHMTTVAEGVETRRAG